MLVLIKTPTITFSLDVQPEDSLEVLYNKVAERTNNKKYQFQLTFAGDALSKGTVGACGIKKESTIHMLLIKEIKLTISYLDKEYQIEIPNNAGLKILHLVRQIKTSLASQIPAVTSNTINLYRKGTGFKFTDTMDLQENISNFDTVDMTIVTPPPPPPSSTYNKSKTTTTTTTTSSYNKKGNHSRSYSTSSSSDSSDDDERYKFNKNNNNNNNIYKSSGPSKTNNPSTEYMQRKIKEREEREERERRAKEQEQMDDDNLLKSFVTSSMSSDVEIVFCFDTTGSMATIIASVRSQIVQTVTRLMKDIPNIRIGVMGLGDYCDGINMLKVLDLTTNIDEIVSFIKMVPDTNGGDPPECYEYALYKAKELSWSEHTSKAFVMIGDSNPHEPTYTNLNINWFEQCDDLYNRGVKVYGVRALGTSVFYDDIAQRTGGLSINFKKFNLITEMFLAICYREASKEQFDKYQNEIKDQGDVCEEMNEILDDLNKENFVVKEGTEEVIEETIKEEPTTTTTTTTTITTTTATATKPNNIIFKVYGKPSHIKINEPWYNINPNLQCNPSFFYNPNIGYFENYRVGKRAAAASLTVDSTTSVSDGKASTLTLSSGIKLFDFETRTVSNVEPFKKTTTSKEKTIYIVGDSNIGKTTFVNNLNYVGKNYNSKLRFKEKSTPLSQVELDSTDLFIVCFTLQGTSNSYNNFTNYFTEIRKRDPMKPIAIALLQNDLPAEPNNKSTYQPQALEKLYSLAGTIEFSSKMTQDQIKNIEKSINSKLSSSSSSSSSCNLM